MKSHKEDDRIIMFVRYNNELKLKEVVENLNWAKAWNVVDLSIKHITIKVYVKPQYAKHFKKEQKDSLIEFSRVMLGDNMKMYKIDGTFVY